MAHMSGYKVDGNNMHELGNILDKNCVPELKKSKEYRSKFCLVCSASENMKCSSKYINFEDNQVWFWPWVNLRCFFFFLVK